MNQHALNKLAYLRYYLRFAPDNLPLNANLNKRERQELDQYIQNLLDANATLTNLLEKVAAAPDDSNLWLPSITAVLEK